MSGSTSGAAQRAYAAHYLRAAKTRESRPEPDHHHDNGGVADGARKEGLELLHPGPLQPRTAGPDQDGLRAAHREQYQALAPQRSTIRYAKKSTVEPVIHLRNNQSVEGGLDRHAD